MVSPPPTHAFRFLVGYQRIGRAFKAYLDPMLEARFGLDRRGFMVLNAIHHGVRYPTEIAEHLGMNKDSASRVLQTLHRAELIHRAIDADDSRRTRLEVAPAGVELLEAIRTALSERLEPLLEKLGPNTREDFLGSFERFGEFVADELGDDRDGR